SRSVGEAYPTRRGAFKRRSISDCPASASQGAPECAGIRSRRLYSKRGSMVMPMYCTVVRTTAVQRQFGAGFFSFVVATDGCNWRPVRHRRGKIRCKGCVIILAIYNFAAKNGEHRTQMDDVIFRHGEIVIGQYRKIRELTRLDLSLLALLIGKPCVCFGPQTQRGLAVETIVLWIECEPSNSPRRHQ